MTRTVHQAFNWHTEEWTEVARIEDGLFGFVHVEWLEGPDKDEREWVTPERVRTVETRVGE